MDKNNKTLIEPKIEPLSPVLDAALKNNNHVDIIRLKSGGSLIITEIVSPYLVDCNHSDDCTEFAIYTVLLICGDGEDLVAHLCPHHLKEHIDFAKSNPAYIIH